MLRLFHALATVNNAAVYMGNRCFLEMLILFPLDIQEYLENIMGLVRDHCNKVNITIESQKMF